MQSLIWLLPFVLLLACPLLMFFMMRGMHGGHGAHGAQDGNDAGSSQAGHGHETEEDSRVGADTSTRLQAMEQEVAALRRELAAGRAGEPSRSIDGHGR